MLGALILAGGKSKRIKENKALIRLNGKPLLLHVTERVIKLTSETIVVIGKNDETSTYAAVLPSAVTVLKDAVDGKGPLAGILPGMQSMRSEYAVVLPCDSPFVKIDVIQYLFNKAQMADAAIPCWPNGDIEPLHAVYKVTSAVPAAEAALQKEELLIIDMIKRLDKVVYASTDEIKNFDQKLVTFFNINTREDLKTAEKMKSNTETSFYLL
jgi:molybdopterin-guanine dinucleotide biosynthesis protein A